jgi:hypothetical protein
MVDEELMEIEMNTSYELGARYNFQKFTAPIVWNDTKSIEGVIAYARDERSKQYVRVYEVAPTEWVQGEPQSWSRGNFENVESAKVMARKAYKWLNKGMK